MDELISLHERLIVTLRSSLSTSGLLHYACVIPYGIALVVLIIPYWKFLLRPPKNIMILFLVSGALFVTGAIGLEMRGKWYDALYGDSTTHIKFLYTLKELLEMLGISTFIYALPTHLVDEFKLTKISIKN